MFVSSHSTEPSDNPTTVYSTAAPPSYNPACEQPLRTCRRLCPWENLNLGSLPGLYDAELQLLVVLR